MHLKTFGGLELTVSAETRLPNRAKPLLLLAYLAIEGPKERHHLAELFWPTANRPLDNLRVALSQLRAAAPGVLSESASMSAGAGAALRAGAGVGTTVGCDALDLLRALEAADRARARELYAGEFLAGLYLRDIGAELEEWVLTTRDHLASSVQMAGIAESEGLAAASAFAEAGRIAVGALGLVHETDPELLPRLHRLLSAADHPFAADVARQAATYGMRLTVTPPEARADLTAGSKRTAPHNLPVRVSPFVGRDTELVTLTNLLAGGSRLVTVTGIGGVGKSRLALQAATAALRDGLFEDGVYLVELATVPDPGAVLGAIASSIDPTGAVPENQLAEAIGGRKILLLLDNFERVTDAGPSVTALLEACPGLTALVTSRQPLDLAGEQLFRLLEFHVPETTTSADHALTLDAVRLFQSVARRAQLSFTVGDTNRDEVLEICRLVHGLPLGIELAAAWAGRLSLDALVDALRRRSDELLKGPKDAASRQRSLRATIDHSWSLLSDEERRVLAALSVFSGGFTHDAAARVAGASLVSLSTLTARSLLNASADGRYSAHPLIAAYASEQLEGRNAERTAASEAHARYFTDLTARAEEGLKGGEQAGWLKRLDTELPNLHAAMSWLLARARAGSIEAARAALEASGALWQYWPLRGRLAEGRALAEDALAVAPEDELPAARAKALTGAGVLSWRQGDTAASEGYHRAALEIRRRTGDRLGEARSLYNLAALAGSAGDLGSAEEHLTAAIAIFREQGDQWSVAYTLFNLSTLAMQQGRVEEAISHLEERLRLQATLGDQAGMAESHGRLGQIKVDLRDLAGAEVAFESALAIARQLEDARTAVLALEGLALVAHEKGLHSRSKELFGEVEAIRAEHDCGITGTYERLVAIHRPGATVGLSSGAAGASG